MVFIKLKMVTKTSQLLKQTNLKSKSHQLHALKYSEILRKQMLMKTKLQNQRSKRQKRLNQLKHP
eukprot:UN10020